jgi:uncharacterized protein YutE (UPF0331/DUF86 family)
MSLNPDLVRSRASDIEESLARLEGIRRMGRDAFLSDDDSKDLACYRLMVAIEAALALCYHVAARRLSKVPEEYAECFGNLGQAGIVPEDLAYTLQQMARFRNLLVHVYWRIDYGKVYDILQSNLEDLHRFSALIVALL